MTRRSLLLALSASATGIMGILKGAFGRSERNPVATKPAKVKYAKLFPVTQEDINEHKRLGLLEGFEPFSNRQK